MSDDIGIDRVIDGNEVKTFEAKTIVLNLDNNPGAESYVGCVVKFKNPVRVLSDDGSVIGAATLEVIGSRIEGHFFIDYHTPERLNIENKTEKLYPLLTSSEVSSEEEPNKVVECEIIEIWLTTEQPLDKRIDAL